MRKVVVMAAFLGLLAGCGLDSQGSCKDGWTSCGGDGCMPDGADCCPSGEGYCDSGKYCGTDNMCHTGGSGGGGGNTCSAQGYAYTCINNTCSPGLWCCHNGCSGCGCR
jgi:hypothetical protein